MKEVNAKTFEAVMDMLLKWIDLSEQSDMRPEDECAELYCETTDVLKALGIKIIRPKGCVRQLGTKEWRFGAEDQPASLGEE